MPSNKGMPVRSKRRPGVDTTDDMSSIATVLQNLVRDWDRRDVAAFGRAFTPSATYATGAGREARGRPAIRDLGEARRGGRQDRRPHPSSMQGHGGHGPIWLVFR